MNVKEHVLADGVVVLYLAGEIDLAARRELNDAMVTGITAASRAMILDLGAVEFMDSTGLNALVRVRNILKIRGVPLVLASINGVGRLLELAGLNDFFTTSPDVDAALMELGLGVAS